MEESVDEVEKSAQKKFADRHQFEQPGVILLDESTIQ